MEAMAIAQATKGNSEMMVWSPCEAVPEGPLLTTNPVAGRMP
jgi:hypothetical protein